MRVAVDGGVPVEICEARDGRGGAWGRDDTIVFSPFNIDVGLWRVAATGGQSEPVTTLDTARGDNSHRWPVFLPDGIHFVYFVRSLAAERRGVYLARVDRPSTPGTLLFHSESEARFAPTDDQGGGVLATASQGHVDVYPLETRRLRISGEPQSLPLPAAGNTPREAAMLSVSRETLAYVGSEVPYGARLSSVLSTGGDLRQEPASGIVNWPRVSPDGTRLVAQWLDPVTGSPDLWVEDLARGTRVRATREGTSAQLPVWSPDSTKLAYVAGPARAPVLTIGAADGTGAPAAVPCPRPRCEPTDWTADGRWLLVVAQELDGSAKDVWMLPADRVGAQRPLLTEPFSELDARTSPDGRLLAYVSEESGRSEISVRSLQGAPKRSVVSAGGGSQPVWTRDGTALLFVDPAGALRRVRVQRDASGGPVVGEATRLPVPSIGSGHWSTQYDLSPDGRRLYFLDQGQPAGPREVGVVLGWRGLLK